MQAAMAAEDSEDSDEEFVRAAMEAAMAPDDADDSVEEIIRVAEDPVRYD